MPSERLTSLENLDSAITNSGKTYPNPFFDLAKNFIPKNIKTLFKYCRTFYYTNSFIRNVITKLTEYPITDILLDSSREESVKDKWDIILNTKLKIKSFLIEIGLDYYTYGNAFISVQIKHKRFLKCSSCNVSSPIETVQYKLKKFRFFGSCPSCKSGGITFSIDDQVIKSAENLKFVRWSPEHIDIDYNPITNDGEYYYNIPAALKSKILKGNKAVLTHTPKVFLDSLREKKRIVIDKDNFYHFKRPTLAEEDMGWGKPIILPALKLIYYLQTLQRGQEAVANEHIIPKKSIYPANTTTLDPYSMHPDTFVETTEGYKQLKDVVGSTSDKLITERGELTHIVDYKLREIEDWDYMIDVKSHGLFGISTIVNSVHPFKVYNSSTNNMEWKQAKDLTLDDYTGYLIKSYEEPIAGAFYSIQDIDIKLYKTTKYRNGTQQLQPKITMDDNLARFLGFFIAEGYTGKDGMVGFGFHAKETEYHEFCANYLDKLLPATSTEIRVRDNSCDVRKNSVVLKDFLDNFVGRGFDNKTIHNIMKHVGNNKSLQLSLLSGIYDGDGTFFYEKNIYPRLNLKLANLPLIAELRDLLIHMGYYPSIVKDDSSVNRTWSLKLYGHEAEKLAGQLGYKTKDLYDKPSASKNYFIKGGYVYSKVKKINITKYKEVLSIEVSDFTHSYLSIGYINKNTQMNLGKWKSQIEEQVKKWRMDPNHIGIFPIPIGYQELGGNARALMLTPEMKFLEEEIINSMGVPLEFIKGGSTFTSGSVSLRIVENHFLTYRELLSDFINNFVITKVRQFLNYPSMSVSFKKFKMADDIQAKQVVMNLNSSGKLSDSKLLEELGYDPSKEFDEIKKSRTEQRNLLVQDAIAQAEGQGEANIIGMKYQIRAQKEMELEEMRLQAEMFQEELAKELAGIPEEPHKIVEKYALEISMMTPEEQIRTLQKLATKMPTLATLVQSKLSQYQMQEMQAEQTLMPEEPASKEASPSNNTGSDLKQKGPTKGNV